MDPETRNRPGANRTAIRKASSAPEAISDTVEQLQERRLARLFFLSPDVAATIARLAYGAAQ
jgi:hypothetical protein